MSETKTLDFEVSEITVSYGMTMNIGNYESFRVDTQVQMRKREASKTEDLEEAIVDKMFADAWRIAKAQIETKVKAVRSQTEKGSKG